MNAADSVFGSTECRYNINDSCGGEYQTQDYCWDNFSVSLFFLTYQIVLTFLEVTYFCQKMHIST